MYDGSMSSVLNQLERYLLMCTVTNDSRSSRRDIGRRSWNLPAFSIGVMDKRLLDMGSIRWVKIQWIIYYAMMVQAEWRHTSMFRVDPSWRVGQGTRLIPGQRSGMETEGMMGEMFQV